MSMGAKLMFDIVHWRQTLSVLAGPAWEMGKTVIALPALELGKTALTTATTIGSYVSGPLANYPKLTFIGTLLGYGTISNLAQTVIPSPVQNGLSSLVDTSTNAAGDAIGEGLATAVKIPVKIGIRGAIKAFNETGPEITEGLSQLASTLGDFTFNATNAILGGFRGAIANNFNSKSVHNVWWGNAPEGTVGAGELFKEIFSDVSTNFTSLKNDITASISAQYIVLGSVVLTASAAAAYAAYHFRHRQKAAPQPSEDIFKTFFAEAPKATEAVAPASDVTVVAAEQKAS